MRRADVPALVPVDLGRDVRALLTTTATGNLGSRVGDDPVRVARVRAALAAATGSPVLYARQVHGAHVHLVAGDGPPAPLGATDGDEEPDVVAVADALVTTRSDVALGVVVADCVPVLLADPVGRVVGVAHAGRRGLVDGVVGATVAAMVRAGAAPGRVRALVGPAACGRCYEVPAVMRDEVAHAVPGTASTTSWGTPSLDLPAGVAHELLRAGVGEVVRHGGCTIEDGAWFSHRAATGGRLPRGAPARRAGRMAGVVRLL
ncbi:MAG: polyphenol oxidase family protein [Actinotalea sp.]|nr:polyphenol oxidase family protein [Actinotalea sp.]